MATEPAAANWHLREAEALATAQEVDPAQGLQAHQISQRTLEFGPNALPTAMQRSVWSLVLEQFSDFMILVLMAAAVVSGLVGEWTDALVIVVIVLLNATIGLVQSWRADQALAALQRLSEAQATVLRGGQIQQVPAQVLVPGDIVLLEAGNQVPADLRLMKTAQLKVDESALTGESVTVDKHPRVLEGTQHALGDRLGLLVFANGAHLAVPFTLDHALLHELMAQTRTGMAGPRTMIGDAIGLGIRVFDASRAQAKVMILLTDGADTGSRIPPDTAARIAREHDITIHTIAIGTPTATGTDRVDTATLKSIAQLTGGRAALASRFGELQTVYAALDALETANHTRLTHRTRHPLFHWPLGFAVTLLLLWHLGEAVRVFATDVRAKRGVVVDVVAGEPRV